MNYTLEQRLEYARGQAINDQDKKAIQLAIDKIRELKAENVLLKDCTCKKRNYADCFIQDDQLTDPTQSIGIDDE